MSAASENPPVQPPAPTSADRLAGALPGTPAGDAREPPAPTAADRLAGVLLGTAIGDALGLPTENLSPRRLRALFGPELRHRFLPGIGMVSDDTEHSALTALCLLDAPDDAGRFARRLGWRLRLWFICLPAGVGLATARACIKLWLGFPATKSGVFSGGNGPSMRSALLGAYFCQHEDVRRAFVTASARLTHTGPQAIVGALAVAELAALEAAGTFSRERCLAVLRSLSSEAWWTTPLAALEQHLARDASVQDYALALGLERGVTGYSMHSVPVALYAWLRHRPDFATALQSALACGGDTDSVGAVVGGLGGACVGAGGLPADWRDGIKDWPWSITRLAALGAQLADAREGKPSSAPLTLWPLVAVRNLFFLVVVLLHGFRRLLPPY